MVCNLKIKQECILVGCVQPASVTRGTGGGVSSLSQTPLHKHPLHKHLPFTETPFTQIPLHRYPPFTETPFHRAPPSQMYTLPLSQRTPWQRPPSHRSPFTDTPYLTDSLSQSTFHRDTFHRYPLPLSQRPPQTQTSLLEKDPLEGKWKQA